MTLFKWQFPQGLASGAALFLSLAVMPLHAAAPSEVLSAHACSACHGMTQKLVGPGFSEIAAKYKGQKDAKTHLTARIRSGGVGLWGPVPMPAQAAISDADIVRVVDWLLAGAAP